MASIEYPSHTCSHNPLCSAHHYKEIVEEVFYCIYCYTPLYQPRSYYHAINFRRSQYSSYVNSYKRILGAVEILSALATIHKSLGAKELELILISIMFGFNVKKKHVPKSTPAVSEWLIHQERLRYKGPEAESQVYVRG